MYENLTDDEKETQPGTFHMIEPFFYTKFSQHPCCGVVAGMPEKIKSNNKQDGIQKAWYQNPFPEFIFFDKLMGFEIRLYGDDDFFEHIKN